MSDDHHDDDLRSAFRKLRADDTGLAPDFQAALEPRRSWRWRPVPIGAGLVGVAAVAILLVFSNQPRQPEALAQKPAPDEIAFDQLSELIDRELTVTTVSAWRSPTSFLLNPDS